MKFKLNISLKKIVNNLKSLKQNRFVFIGTLSISLIFFFVFSFFFYYHNRIFPRVNIVGVSVANKTPAQAKKILREKVVLPEKIFLTAKDQTFEIVLQEVDFSYDFSRTAISAYSLYGDRAKEVFQNTSDSFKSLFQKKNLDLVIKIDYGKLNEKLLSISEQISIEPIYPSVSLEEGKVIVNQGETGKIVDVSSLQNLITQNLMQANHLPVFIPFITINPTLSDEEVETLQKRADSLLGKSLTLVYEYESIVAKDKEIISFLNPKSGWHDKKLQIFINEVKEKVNRNPQDAILVFLSAQADQSGRVEEFKPAKNGLAINEDLLKEKILENFAELESSEKTVVKIEIPLIEIPPAVSIDQVNNLGIKELVGRGSSKFAGSISSRIFNIGLASSKLNGALVKPGETFSFNNALGEVSTATGYQQAYIIKDGNTVLDDGGGLCQVSTTLFRAVLKAGLPTVERRSHSYRVSYYEQDSPPGFDATVYSPTTDFKFANDTPGHILIQTIYSAKNRSLAFELYGTSDGRITATTKPIVTDVTPPPEDLYIDDPTLPIGEIKQIDYKNWGAKVWFDYKVERDGETIYEKRFLSIYQPWQAKFLRGTGSL